MCRSISPSCAAFRKACPVAAASPTISASVGVAAIIDSALDGSSLTIKSSLSSSAYFSGLKSSPV